MSKPSICLLLLAVCCGNIPALAGSLSTAYTDPAYLTKLPFGTHSHYIQPWRSCLETVPAAQFINAVGIVLNIDQENPDVVLQMLAKNGVRNGRIEIGWGLMSWDDTLTNTDRLRAMLLACKKWGVRPLLLLNAHHGGPGPTQYFQRTVTADAPAGATTVMLNKVDDLVIGHSGLSQLTDYWAAEALITKIEGNTVTLSKPLPKAISAGTNVPMATLKYRPFSVPGSDDYKDTMAGWLRYVGVVATFAADTLGTTNSPDKGFDMEIWNELSFGSNFLNINAYYQPAYAKYDQDSIWHNVVVATAQYVDAHVDAFSGVRFNDGFSNTIPWTNSGNEPLRISAIGKHPYAGRKHFPQDDQQLDALNALGVVDKYCPTYSEMFPEYFWTAIQTETVMRDAAPITTDIYGSLHGRNARPNAPCTVWITEVGIAPNEDGITDHAQALTLKAKTTARYLAFLLNKGVDKLTLFAAMGGDLWLGLVQDNFVEYAKTHNSYPADDSSYTSPALQVMRRMVTAMQNGMDAKLTATRPLTVDTISDTHDHYQFAGDGTAAHPPLYDREVFAFLPFQANAHKFVIPYYVMTRDVRQALVPEDFTITVSGIHGIGAIFSAYDPITDGKVPVIVKAVAANSATLTLRTTDYPYLLTVEETK